MLRFHKKKKKHVKLLKGLERSLDNQGLGFY